MGKHTGTSVEVPPGEGVSLPLLVLLFVGSGCAALIYEVIWLQLLQLVIGSSAVSLGVLLGTFMGGMCLGSLLLPRYVSMRHHPLRVYGWLELGIALIAVLVVTGVPLIGRLYAAVGGGHGFIGILMRGLLCGVCLLPPTLLMGATLPAISRWIGTTGTAVSWLGFFYGANIAGAVAGSLAAGFYLLRMFDMVTATGVAMAINVAVGSIALVLARRSRYEAAGTAVAAGVPANRPPGWRYVYATIALSGLCALGAEVIWTRILSLMLGATTYTFSIILAVFLTGLGIGSSAGSYLSRTAANPRAALGWCQLLAALSIGWTALMLGASLPYWPINPFISTSPWFTFQVDIVRCFWALLPATILWGASFPLALAAAVERGQDPGRLVGGVYAANTVGAIAGAIGFSMVTVPIAGTHGAQRVLIVLSAVSGFLVLVTGRARSEGRSAISGLLRDGAVIAASVVILLLAWRVPPVPAGLVAYGRSLPTRDETDIKYLYKGEGLNSSVAVSELPGGIRNFHVSGKVEASTEPQDMRLQRMLGNLPAALHPDPKSVLIVGFGAGVTAGSFVPYREIERIVICEIEPLIPTHVAPYFERENFAVLRDPRVTMFYDDARHHVLTMGEKFDIITSDPIHPWVKGAATLYTKEYFELVKAHLKPGGLVTQWVPLYESTPEVVKSEAATFFEVFPNGTIWANLNNGEGYDVVLLGQAGDGPLNLDAAQARMARPEREAVRASLEDVGFVSLVDLLSTYAGHAEDMRGWLQDAEINRDRNLRLQYLAGMQPNLYEGGRIYNEMVSYRQPFGDRVIASAELREALRRHFGVEY
jgi:spermidine synthase